MHGIAYWIDKRALTTPHPRVALLNETRKLTYNEMAQEVNQLARTLYESSITGFEREIELRFYQITGLSTSNYFLP